MNCMGIAAGRSDIWTPEFYISQGYTGIWWECLDASFLFDHKMNDSIHSAANVSSNLMGSSLNA